MRRSPLLAGNRFHRTHAPFRINHLPWHTPCFVNNTPSHREYCVMEWDTPIEFDPVILILHNPDRLLSVRTAIGAANALMKEFPCDDGEEFLAAIRICIDV